MTVLTTRERCARRILWKASRTLDVCSGERLGSCQGPNDPRLASTAVAPRDRVATAGTATTAGSAASGASTTGGMTGCGAGTGTDFCGENARGLGLIEAMVLVERASTAPERRGRGLRPRSLEPTAISTASPRRRGAQSLRSVHLSLTSMPGGGSLYRRASEAETDAR
jgi:hypothetical protein